MPDPALPSPELITEIVAQPFQKLCQTDDSLHNVPFLGEILATQEGFGICWSIAMAEAIGSLDQQLSSDLLLEIGILVGNIRIPLNEVDAEAFFTEFPVFRPMKDLEIRYLISKSGGLSRRLSEQDPSGMAAIINYVLRKINSETEISIPVIDMPLATLDQINSKFSQTCLPVLSINMENFDEENNYINGSGHMVLISGVRRNQQGELVGIQISDPNRDYVYWLDERSFNLIKSGKPITYRLENGNTHKISISPKNPIIWLSKKA